jgi:hypothetical protein
MIEILELFENNKFNNESVWCFISCLSLVKICAN